MTTNSFLLYGANGYTGELIARYAADYQLAPILAGRRREVIEPLAEKLKLPFLVFDLEDSSALQSALHSVKLVVHAAGPFRYTARQMVEACLQTGTHYLDINGDISVFELLRGYSARAKEKGIMIMPGVGFDVVPTDCLALLLKKLLPDAIDLKLAFATLGGALSHGTATTVVDKLGEGGAVRKNGKIIAVPLGQRGRWIDFGSKKLFAMTIPWGDISTAYTTTGIPNIEVYTGISPRTHRLLKLQPLFNWLLRTSFIKNLLHRKINKSGPGPSDEKRAKAKTFVWGEARNSAGQYATARMTTPDGYTLTMYSTLIIAKKVLEGNFQPGYQTPAGVYSEDLILEIPNVEREIISIPA